MLAKVTESNSTDIAVTSKASSEQQQQLLLVWSQ
jgi:hypothetical protein